MDEDEERDTKANITPAVDVKEQDGWGKGPELNMDTRGAEEGATNKDTRPLKPPERDREHPTNNCETLIHVLKGNLGTGLLAMPEAFKHSGLWVGFVGVPLMGLICIHCMHVLLKCSRELSARTGRPSLSYEETAKAAFSAGPEKCRRWANVVGYTITTFLIITQIGFCCVYFVFVPQNLKQAIDGMVEGGTGISNFAYMSMLIIPFLLICYIPDLKYLAPVSLIAGVIQTVGLAICLYYMVRDLPVVDEVVPGWAGWSTLPLYFGSAVYAFEGIGLVLPLENNMATPEAFGGFNGVLNTAMMVVVCLYAGFGFFGYLTYGSNVEGSITLNLPNEELAQAVKILMAVAVYMSYPLQMYVPYEILTPSVLRMSGRVSPDIKESKTKSKIVEYAFRTACVLLTFVLAAAIPNIGLFISLVGAVSSSTLALIFPPIVETVTFWPDTGRYHWRAIKCVLIGLFGIVGFITGSVSSVQAIIDYFVYGDK